MEPFDLTTLGKSAQRSLCESLISRGIEALDSLAAAYLPDREKPQVEIRFTHSPLFNASISKVSEGHTIDIHIAIPLLLQALFGKLLSSPEVVPELPFIPQETSRWSAPFVRDLGAAMIDDELSINLDPNRQVVAQVMQDFCCWFVVLHEISHLVCGHAQGASHFFDEPKLQEFFGLEFLFKRGRYLKRSWEYDADVTAASLLVQYIQYFHESPAKNRNVNAAFQFLNGSPARLVGFVTGSLFAMFVYLSQMEYHLEVRSHHPHPMLRTKYIGQTLLRKAAADYGIDKDEIYEWQIEYMGQMAQEMEKMGLFNWDEFDASFSESDSHLDSLSGVAARLRKSCARWSWFPLDHWQSVSA